MISSNIIILVVIALALYLIYNNNKQSKNIVTQQTPKPQIITKCQDCEYYRKQLQKNSNQIKQNTEPYVDVIKRQDLHSMEDPLTYPQLRLPREVLHKYQEYYEKNGVQPPFGQATQGLFDTPLMNGVLIKQVEDNEPFSDNLPNAVPLIRVKSAKNTNRFFYYIIDQRYPSRIEIKIPLVDIIINGMKCDNADFYGLPELYDGDIIENIPIYPGSRFKVMLYKVYHFP